MHYKCSTRVYMKGESFTMLMIMFDDYSTMRTVSKKLFAISDDQSTICSQWKLIIPQ